MPDAARRWFRISGADPAQQVCRSGGGWWLQDGDTIYDVTVDQYNCRNKVPPYDVGKESKWYGWKQRPQQLSLDLMVKVLGRRLALDDTVNV